MYTAKDEAIKLFLEGTETGFISQNICLYCASSGLNTAIIALVDREKLYPILALPEPEKMFISKSWVLPYSLIVMSLYFINKVFISCINNDLSTQH